MDPFVKVAEVSDLLPGQLRLVEVGDDKIVVANLDGTFFAVSDECTHAGCSLSDGNLDGSSIECPCHGAMFDIRTGDVVAPPAIEPVRSYMVRIDGDSVMVGSVPI